MEKPRVVILGGGFAGVSVARRLFSVVKRGEISLTLVNDKPDFLFTPLLHEVATGSLSPASVNESLFDIFAGIGAHLVIGSVDGVDAAKQVVVVNGQKLAYDFLVIATGARSNASIEGFEFAYPLKTLADANAIRAQILQIIHSEIAPKIAVIGSGPTAVETVAELSEYARQLSESRASLGLQQVSPQVQLITSSPTPLYTFPKSMQNDAVNRLRQLGVEIIHAKAKRLFANGIENEKGETYTSHLTILTIGVVSNVPTCSPAFDVHESGRILVADTLLLHNHKNIFALGDVAARNTPDAMLAQIATQQAQVVAENILRIIHHQQPRAFAPKLKGLLVSLGAWHATAQIGTIHLKGKFAWWLWRTVYFFKFPSNAKRFRIAFEWTANLFFDRDSTSIHYGTKT